MPIIGATQLEPVNILGSYVQGLEAGRANKLAQAEQQRLARQGEMEEARFAEDIAAKQATRRNAELEAKLKGHQMIADFASAAVDEPSYQQVLQNLQGLGLDTSKLPPNFDAKFVAQQRRAALTEAQRIEAELKGRELSVRERTVGVQETQAKTAAEREARMARSPATSSAAGGAGKPDKLAAGADAFEGVIGEMESAYDQLDQMAAIPSTKRSAAENLAISLRTSGAGQMMGRAAGTPEQSLRNQIQSARLRLLQGIKAATGMSAQELNSNVELQQWLDAVTNPANDVESNRKILNSIRTFVARRSGKEVPAAPPAAAPSPSGASATDPAALAAAELKKRREGKR